MTLNKYIQDLLDTRIKSAPESIQKLLMDEAEQMNGVGVQSPEDHKHFMVITMHVPHVAKDMLRRDLSAEELANISHHIYSHVKDFPVNTILNLFFAVENALNTVGLTIAKKAYPHDTKGIYIAPSYNINKWLQAMRDIYSRIQQGIEKPHSFEMATASWDKMERSDFKHWLSFYEEGAHKKYVTADQQYYESPQGNFIPASALKAQLPSVPMPDMSDFHPVQQQTTQEERRSIIEDQRKKITGRLNAAERILTSEEGKIFAGKEFETLLTAIQALKVRVQTANKMSVASTLFEDLIYKTANLLRDQGLKKSAKFMYKVANGAIPEPTPQPVAPGVPAPEPGLPAVPPAEPQPTPALPKKDKSELPPDPTQPPPLPTDPAQKAPPSPSTIAPKDEKPGVYDKFLKGLDINESDDDIEIDSSEDDDAAIVVEAQGAPGVVAPEPVPAVPAEGKPEMEVELPEERNGRTDDIIEQALSNVTVKDIINRLDSLSNIFKTREIPRQLSIVDMMMDTLGIGSYFPEIGEALRSALESNSYISTRIDGVIGRIRGTVKPEIDIDLQGGQGKSTPEVTALKATLEEKQKKDEARKERRKREEEETASSAVVPEELGVPAKVEPGPIPPRAAPGPTPPPAVT